MSIYQKRYPEYFAWAVDVLKTVKIPEKTLKFFLKAPENVFTLFSPAYNFKKFSAKMVGYKIDYAPKLYSMRYFRIFLYLGSESWPICFRFYKYIYIETFYNWVLKIYTYIL